MCRLIRPSGRLVWTASVGFRAWPATPWTWPYLIAAPLAFLVAQSSMAIARATRRIGSAAVFFGLLGDYGSTSMNYEMIQYGPMIYVMDFLSVYLRGRLVTKIFWRKFFASLFGHMHEILNVVK